MSEKQHFESSPNHEQNKQSVEAVERKVSHEKASIQESSPDQQQEKLQAIRQEVGREARASTEVRPAATHEKTIAHHGPIKRELQDMMFVRTLTSIRKKLPAGQRTFSKVVHNKTVDRVSAVGEKTVARPYGILGGGIIALLGSAYTFYTAKHYGFRYNFLLFFMLFVAGYIAATVLEVLYKVIRQSK